MRKTKWKNPGTSHNSEYRNFYESWLSMFKRVRNPIKWPTYTDVSICERWNSYDNFFEDMADTWFEGAVLDKDIIKPGNRVYCKEYCKWVSRSENIRERNLRVVPEGIMKNKFGAEHNRSKKVKCVETGKIYGSCHEAERELSLGYCSVSRAANPNSKQNLAGNYHWEYV